MIATVFEPASEHGQRGMDELHQQTVNLLSFQALPKNVYDMQVAFNMVARYGSESQTSLETIEAQSASTIGSIAPRCDPSPRCMLMQAPIFHGHAFAIYRRDSISQSRPSIVVERSREITWSLPAPMTCPNNVSSAGQGDILVSLKNDASRDERRLALGRSRQSSDRGPHRGRMRREHDRHSSAGKIQ